MHPSGIAQSISITHSKLDSPIVFSCELLILKLRVQDEFQHFYFARCYPFYAVANKTRFFFKCDKKKIAHHANLHKRHKKIAALIGSWWETKTVTSKYVKP